MVTSFFFFQAEDGIRDLVRSRGLGDVYKRQTQSCMTIATTVGLSVLKKILIGGVSKGLGIFKDKNSFLGNELILSLIHI